MMSSNERETMKSKYPRFIDSVDPLNLELSNVPENLRRFIPYAEVWGRSDDLEREQLMERAPEEAKSDLVQLIEQIDDELDDWLAGPEADGKPSNEYIAFSAMRMAVDFM